jgi:hypothetical protein
MVFIRMGCVARQYVRQMRPAKLDRSAPNRPQPSAGWSDDAVLGANSEAHGFYNPIFVWEQE